MFKRIVAYCLIFLQIYGVLFQGAIHANFADHYAIGNQAKALDNINSRNINISAKNNVNIREVHDVDEYESFTETDNGWFGGTTTSQTLDQRSISKGAKFKVAESVEIFSFGDVNITNPNLLTPLITLDSVDGVVKILAGTNSESHSGSTKSEGMCWQSVELKGSSHKTYTMPQIPGEVVINSQQNAILQKVHGQVLEYAKRIKVEGGGKLVFEDLHESHQYFHEKQDGPTAALAAVVAIAISLATANPGSGLGAMVTSGATATMGATAAGVLGLMTAGAFMGICSQAGLALLQTKGNVGKAAKILTSKDSFKKIAKSAVL